MAADKKNQTPDIGGSSDGLNQTSGILVQHCLDSKGLTTVPEISFHADSNELLFVSIALTLTEILVDCVVPDHSSRSVSTWLADIAHHEKTRGLCRISLFCVWLHKLLIGYCGPSGFPWCSPKVVVIQSLSGSGFSWRSPQPESIMLVFGGVAVHD